MVWPPGTDSCCEVPQDAERFPSVKPYGLATRHGCLRLHLGNAECRTHLARQIVRFGRSRRGRKPPPTGAQVALWSCAPSSLVAINQTPLGGCRRLVIVETVSPAARPLQCCEAQTDAIVHRELPRAFLPRTSTLEGGGSTHVISLSPSSPGLTRQPRAFISSPRPSHSATSPVLQSCLVNCDETCSSFGWLFDCLRI